MRQGNYTEDTLRAAKIGLEKGYEHFCVWDQDIINAMREDLWGHRGVRILPCRWSIFPLMNWQFFWNTPEFWLSELVQMRRYPGLLSADHLEHFCPQPIQMLHTVFAFESREQRQLARNIALAQGIRNTQPGGATRSPDGSSCACGERASLLHVPSTMKLWPWVQKLFRFHRPSFLPPVDDAALFRSRSEQSRDIGGGFWGSEDSKDLESMNHGTLRWAMDRGLSVITGNCCTMATSLGNYARGEFPKQKMEDTAATSAASRTLRVKVETNAAMDAYIFIGEIFPISHALQSLGLEFVIDAMGKRSMMRWGMQGEEIASYEGRLLTGQWSKFWVEIHPSGRVLLNWTSGELTSSIFDVSLDLFGTYDITRGNIYAGSLVCDLYNLLLFLLMASVLSILLLAIASTMSAARRGGHELQTDYDYESTMQGESCDCYAYEWWKQTCCSKGFVCGRESHRCEKTLGQECKRKWVGSQCAGDDVYHLDTKCGPADSDGKSVCCIKKGMFLEFPAPKDETLCCGGKSEEAPAEPAVSKKTGSNKIRQVDRQEAEVSEQVDVVKPPVKAQASKEEVKPVVQAPIEEIKKKTVQAPREEIKQKTERIAREQEQRRQDELKAKAANQEKERLAEQLKIDLQKMEEDRLKNIKKEEEEKQRKIKQKTVQAPREEIKQKTVQAPKEEIKQKPVQAPKEDIKQKTVGRKDEIRQKVPQYSSKAEAGKIDVKQVASYSSSSSSSVRQVAPWKNVDEAYSGWAPSQKEHWTGQDWSERWNEHWTSAVQPDPKKESKAWKTAQPDPKKDLKAPESQWKSVTSPKAEAKSTTAWRTIETPTEETKEVKEVKEVKVWRPVVTPKEEVNAQVVDPKQDPKVWRPVETPKEESKEVKEVKVWRPVVETAQEESKEAKEVKEVKDVKSKAVESKQEPKVWRPVESPKEEVTSKTEQHHAKQEAKAWKAASVPEKKPPKRQAVKETEWNEWTEWSEWHEWVESKPEKKQEKKTFKDETTRLAEAAIKIITGQVKVPENKGFVWVDEWQERFSATLGTVREFLESRPDKFQVMPTSGRGYRVALVKQEYAKWKTTRYW
eukprot:symbB.v1.2.016530.t1/scaffold1257.1/size128495/9